ncbi:zinc-binding dehydrogenase [Pseudomaricurvus alkylphenolicus]|jgi:threonine dehydrogenase-like Zn-dependent dehydrogenase|uniref:zinc-binding dehydrogenase n=1 Tax=Pseudomaricurvus alkylphenolicus TaxID=1306991 RepID=UPI0014222860|nr:zinc-binding dehydrogenase [Pseudomaricurvus alkylphenolicus]NIB38026.1 zinc-binding dehydrogenase [Pseudomaricurvus alkylphenolicus]
MQAAIIRDKQFWIEDIPTPQPGPGQVLVKVLSCGICGSDIHLFNQGPDLVAKAAAAGAPIDDIGTDMVLGHEFVGEIVSFGPETTEALAVGDRVTSVPFLMKDGVVIPIGASKATTGAYAQYLLLTEAALVLVPESMSNDAAALAEPLAIGVHAVAKANAVSTDAALVIGCGPIGLATVAALRMRGVTQIIAADYSNRRRQLAEQMGASRVVNPAEENPYEALQSITATDNIIFECVGLKGLIHEIIVGAPQGSRVVIAGICMEEDLFMPMLAVSKELCLQFVTYYTPEEFAESLQALAEERFNWRPWITGRVNLRGVSDAFEALKDPEQHAKILIEPWS